MWKAWIINAIVIGITSGITVELRDFMDAHEYTKLFQMFHINY